VRRYDRPFVGAVDELAGVGRPGDRGCHPDAGVLIELMAEDAVGDAPEAEVAELLPAAGPLESVIAARDHACSVEGEANAGETFLRECVRDVSAVRR
jgi:hypothetical protein